MSLMDSIGKKAAGLAQTAAKKSGDLVETTKLSLKIGTEESKIEKSLVEIGKLVLAAHKAGGEVSTDIWTICESIRASESVIAELKEKIRVIKKIKLCANCGLEVERSSSFCSGCGAKLEKQA